jgi:hypothetical protein
MQFHRMVCRGILMLVIALAPLLTASAQTAVGVASGGSTIGVFNSSGVSQRSFTAFPGFSGGVRVAVGDVTGDGANDIIAGTGPGGATVKVFDGITGAETRSFVAAANYTGGVTIAAGDINGDGRADLIVGTETDGTVVRVFDGVTNAELRAFFAFDPAFRGGVRVAAGDVNSDGRVDIIAATGPGAAQIRVFDGVTNAELRSFIAYSAFTGGVFVGGADVDRDGRADIITGAGSGSPHVKVFSGATGAELRSFFAFGVGSGGVRVAGGDVNRDGNLDLVTATASGANNVRFFDGITNSELSAFTAFPGTEGVFVGQIGEPVTLVSASSLKQHGGAGVHGVDLPRGASFPGIECRSGGSGANHSIRFAFDLPVTVRQASITGVGTVASISGNGTTAVTINLAGVADAQTLTIDLRQVSNGSVVTNIGVPMGVLLGDTNADRVVNSGDAIQTRSRAGQSTNATNFRSDGNVDGVVNSGDTILVRARGGNVLP